MNCPMKCHKCNGTGFQMDRLRWSIIGKCTLCKGLGWTDECLDENINEKNQKKINEYYDHFRKEKK